MDIEDEEINTNLENENDSHILDVKDFDLVKTKGRPIKNERKKSFLEKSNYWSY